MIGRREFGMGALAALSQDPKKESSIMLWAPRPKTYAFQPKPDITAFELAKMLPLWMGALRDIEKLFEEMPEIKRHFKEVE